MRKLISLLVTLPLLAAGSVHAQNKVTGKLVCWTDDKGQRACGDRVPPQYAKKERQILDAQGRVIDTQSRQKTSEEIAEIKRKEAEETAEKTRFEQQAKYDRYLLQTFANTKELESSRDSRLRALEGQMGLNDKANADTEKTLSGLRDRAATAQKAGKAPDAKLLAQIAEYERTLQQGKQSREQRAKDHAEITAKFGADIERYNALKSGKVQPGAPLPAPAPAPEPAAAPAN